MENTKKYCDLIVCNSCGEENEFIVTLLGQEASIEPSQCPNCGIEIEGEIQEPVRAY
jgi:transcription elongation factor Elf1